MLVDRRNFELDRTEMAHTKSGDRQKRASPKWVEWVWGPLIGLISFLVVVGPAPLRPTNILWLRGSDDPATSYLGWAFYRASPWAWPPAANPRYGLELSGSILMSDSHPLFGLLFKLLSPLLSHPFQYFGIWLLLCFILQATFAYAIARKLFGFPEQRLLSTVLFVFAPPFLWRVAAMFHLTLSGQWEVLAAIFLYLSPSIRRKTLCWTALVIVGILTNPYLLAMILAIWVADILRTLWLRRTLTASQFLNAGLVVVGGIVVTLATGVYAFPATGASPLLASLRSAFGEMPGIYKFNLASPFDSAGWSYFLPRRPNPGPGEYEGFSYLGTGLLLLLACAILMAVRRREAVRIGREHYPLAICLLGLVFFAASPLVSVGATTISVPWPRALIWLGGVFRSTGRFAWPVFYFGIAFILRTLARTMNRRFLTSLLVIAAIIQVGDTSAGWGRFSAAVAKEGSEWPSPMKAPVWKKLVLRYRTIRLATPTKSSDVAALDVSYFALKNGLGVDDVYLARVNHGGFEALSARAAKSRKTGVFGTDSIWILDDATFQTLRRRSACRGDFVADVNGFLILAPNYYPPNESAC